MDYSCVQLGGESAGLLEYDLGLVASAVIAGKVSALPFPPKLTQFLLMNPYQSLISRKPGKIDPILKSLGLLCFHVPAYTTEA